MNTIIKPDYLRDREFEILRSNPDRGWRIETYITLGSNTVMFNKGYTPEEYLDRELEHYKDLNVKGVQVYAYLNEYVKKPLDDSAFNQLEDYLKLLKKRNVRALLRFAYEFDVTMRIGPTSKRIFSHIEQIKAWLTEHEDLVKETVMVIQAGFIGAWGEWHTAKYPHSGKSTLLKICDMTPDYLTVQIRQQKFKDRIKDYPENKKVGYHDDYLVGVYHRWSVMKSGVGTASFNRLVKDSRHTLNDGEMPWGRDKSCKKGYIDGLEMIKGVKLRSLSTMSITHNYTEENNFYNAHRWQSEKLSLSWLDDNSIPYFSTYFNKNEEKSVFDFLTDHLGYMLAVDEIELSEDEVTLTVRNNGFALPFGFTQFKLLIDNGDEIKEYENSEFNFDSLLGGSVAKIKIKADTLNAKAIGISLRKPIENFPSIRFANRCEFIDNINWFKI